MIHPPKLVSVDICRGCRYFQRFYLKPSRREEVYRPALFGRCLYKKRPRLRRGEVCPKWPTGNGPVDRPDRGETAPGADAPASVPQ